MRAEKVCMHNRNGKKSGYLDWAKDCTEDGLRGY